MTYTKKETINKAIFAISFSISDNYDLYLSELTPAERADEHQIVTNAWKTLKENGLGLAEVKKHMGRCDNICPLPVRFIDRIFIEDDSEID